MWFVPNFKPYDLEWWLETKSNNICICVVVWCSSIVWTINIRNNFNKFNKELNKFGQLKILFVIIFKLLFFYKIKNISHQFIIVYSTNYEIYKFNTS